METLTVACLELGDYCGRGVEYVNKLYRGVSKHIGYDFDFVCLTDRTDCSGFVCGVEARTITTNLPGFWAKLGLFQPGIFLGPTLYLDLDVVVHDEIGGITEHLDYGDFWALDDWEFPLSNPRHDYPERLRPLVLEKIGGLGTCNSSVMLWKNEAGRAIWEQFTPEAVAGLHGDQNWVTRVMGDRLGLIGPGWAHSYKQGGTGSLLVFHGDPRPHEVAGPWMGRNWV